MPVCENCQSTFVESKGLVEITSLRVLCPKCVAEREAKRAARAGRESVAQPMRVEAAGKGRVGGPSSRAANDGAPAQKTERRAPPVPARPANARPAPAAPASKEVKEAPASPPPAKKPEAKRPSAKSKRGIDYEHIREETEELRRRANRPILIGYGISAVVVIVCSVVLYIVFAKKKKEHDAQVAHQALMDGFKADLAAFDLTTEEGDKGLLAYVEEHKDLAETEEMATEVLSRSSTARLNLQGIEDRRDLTNKLVAIETELARADQISSESLAEQRRQLEDITPKLAILPPEFTTRAATARETIDRVYVEKVLAESEASASAADPTRASLSQLQSAEEEILKLFSAAYTPWKADPKNEALAAKKEYLEGVYKKIIELSDATVVKVFPPEAIEKLPWIDLLADAQVENWRGETLKGFEHRLERGTMHIIGPDASEHAQGILSIGYDEQWRDFVLEVEFTLVRGGATFFFRLPPNFQANVESLEVSTEGEDALAAGESYALEVSMIGSTRTIWMKANDEERPQGESIKWGNVRKGEVAVALSADSEIKITKMQIRVLR
jgi:hypothetical protein